MVVEIVGQILFLGGLVVTALLVHAIVGIESSLLCLLVGFLAGLGLDYVSFDTGLRAANLKDLVFFVILPVLIFEAAWHLKPSILKRWLVPILMLAKVGVLISCLVSAAIIYVGIGHSAGFPWIAALLTGAILSATDPVAVMSQLRSLKAPEDLSTLFEGESLFNDATAVVLFSIVIGFATQTASDTSVFSYISFFASVFFGGILAGLTLGLLSTCFILIIGKPAVTTLILILTAFASFYIAEHVLHVSGIMAVMMSALVVRFALKDVEAIVAPDVGNTWDFLGLFINSLLFVIMGIVTGIAMFKEQWLAMIIAIVASLLGRAAAVLFSSKMSKPFSDVYVVSKNRQKLLVWGGLRGAIAIALVLSLPVSLPYWWTIQSMVFGVVMFSLLVQGPTNKWALSRLEPSQLHHQ